MENVVTEDKGAGLTGNEVLSDQECLCQTTRRRLNRVGDADAPVGAAAQ